MFQRLIHLNQLLHLLMSMMFHHHKNLKSMKLYYSLINQHKLMLHLLQQCNQHRLLSILHHSIRLRMNLPCLITHLRHSYLHSQILLLGIHMNHYLDQLLNHSYMPKHLYNLQLNKYMTRHRYLHFHYN